MPARPRLRSVLACLTTILAAFASASTAVAQRATTRAAFVPPPIHHVFIIVLENKGYDTTFATTSAAPYLADTLRRAGALLEYYGTAHLSLPNYIAMVSGIAPSRQTQIDCPHYAEFVETGVAADGQPIGDGCIYPAHVQTIANQLEAKHLTWKAYMEDMGLDTTREAATCGHGRVGVADPTEVASPRDQYAAKHDPFVYFHAVLDTPSCAHDVVPLTQLERDLRDASRTPNYVFIAPNLCHDGHDAPCVNGERGGLASADAFLRRWVRRITSSPAFLADGLLIITFDEALGIDTRACCGELSGPNTKMAGINGPGGGLTGAVLLSPFIRPGTRSRVPYNHYSMLRSVEDIFGLPYLGYAGRSGLRAFGPDVYTRAPRRGR